MNAIAGPAQADPRRADWVVWAPRDHQRVLELPRFLRFREDFRVELVVRIQRDGLYLESA